METAQGGDRLMTPDEKNRVSQVLFELIPKDGTPIGNVTLQKLLRDTAANKLKFDITDEDYWEVNELIA
jgi:hypothetical protein